MGACTQAEHAKTIKPVSHHAVQRAIIKDTKAVVQTEAIAPRVAQNQRDDGSPAKVRVRLQGGELEFVMNENVEEPWVCVGDQEMDGC